MPKVFILACRQEEYIISSSETSYIIVDPAFHFSQEYLSDHSSGDDKFLVSELVVKGQLLADYPNAEHLGKQGYRKGELKAGKHTEFSSDGLSLFAQIAGYPKVTMQHGRDDQVTPVVSITPLVTISFDRLSAWRCKAPPLLL